MIAELDNNEGIGARRMIFTAWIILYAFVGSQMAYTLSPFVGDSQQPFVLLAAFGGNFYSSVANAISELLRGFS